MRIVFDVPHHFILVERIRVGPSCDADAVPAILIALVAFDEIPIGVGLQPDAVSSIAVCVVLQNPVVVRVAQDYAVVATLNNILLHGDVRVGRADSIGEGDTTACAVTKLIVADDRRTDAPSEEDTGAGEAQASVVADLGVSRVKEDD